LQIGWPGGHGVEASVPDLSVICIKAGRRDFLVSLPTKLLSARLGKQRLNKIRNFCG
jgi:hypothetical protein